MTLAERVQVTRAEEQAEGTLGDTRVYCGCGCGVWWFRPHVEGRPRAYLNEEHYRREKNRRRAKRVKLAIAIAPSTLGAA